MSEEIENGNKVVNNNALDEMGFQSALYIKVPFDNVDNRLKETTESLEALKLRGQDYEPTRTITPRQSDPYNNFISSDLMKRLEESSPIKSQKSNDMLRRVSEICLLNCENKSESEMMSQKNCEVNSNQMKTETRNLKIEEEFKEIINRENCQNQTENVMNVQNNSRVNYKLKSQIMNIHTHENEERCQEQYFYQNNNNNKIVTNGNEIKEEPESLFKNSMNFSNISNNQSSQGNTYFSPTYKTKQEKKDTSPLYTYYDGTVECLSQTFYDEFKKSSNEKFMSAVNYIKKSDQQQQHQQQQQQHQQQQQQQQPVVFPEESSAGSINTSQSNLYSKVTDDQSSFNSIQLPFNIFNNNNNQNFLNVNNFAQYFTRGGMNNMNNVNLMSNNNLGSNMTNSNISGLGNNMSVKDSNYIDFSQSSDSYNFMNNSYQAKFNMLGNGISNSTPVKRNSIRTSTGPNQKNSINNNILGDNHEEYTVEMFGRKGWICEMCNNFNYETRQKCNRCGGNKSPKKIKGKLHQKSNEKNEVDENEAMNKNNKKKPFVERVGDWVCIKCKNLNFSFRVVCNRCQLPKIESDKMFETYMSNLMNYVQYNELMHKKILKNQNQHDGNGNINSNSAPGYFNNPSINLNNNNHYNNYPNIKTQNYMKTFNPNPNFSNGGNFSGSSMSSSNVSKGVGNNGNISSHYQMSSVMEDEDYYNEGI